MATNLISWYNEENELVADYQKKCKTIYKGRQCTEQDAEEFKAWLEKKGYEVYKIF